MRLDTSFKEIAKSQSLHHDADVALVGENKQKRHRLRVGCPDPIAWGGSSLTTVLLYTLASICDLQLHRAPCCGLALQVVRKDEPRWHEEQGSTHSRGGAYRFVHVARAGRSLARDQVISCRVDRTRAREVKSNDDAVGQSKGTQRADLVKKVGAM